MNVRKTIIDNAFRTLGISPGIKIGLALSGGGYRAVICSLAFVMALRDIGWFDTIDCISSLSGSCWFLMDMLVRDTNLEELKKQIQISMSRAIFPVPKDFTLGYNIIKNKNKYSQPLSILVDLWGGCITNVFLNVNNIENKTLSSLRSVVNTGKYPYPIFTAVNRENGYTWIEFTPFDVEMYFASNTLQVDVQYFNSIWENGKLIKELPEPTIASIMGTVGSAFAISYPDLKRHLPMMSILFEYLDPIASKLDTKSFATGSFYNPFGNNILHLVDGGFDFNYPVIPLIERDMDIIIIGNFSIGDAVHNLTLMFEKLKERYILPNIDLNTYDWTLPQILYEENLLPVIVYVPNEIYASTLQLEYTRDQFDRVFDGMYATVSKLDTLLRKAVQVVENARV